MFIVVLPYTETSRLFHASKAAKEEAFIGAKGIVYYESQAHKMPKGHAEVLVKAQKIVGNKEAFLREVK